ncbi:uncharacterized protein RJT20DRAFT_130802 [Scheffersomyces xylosifermentans]|uniref:uncharacterized protein n=1 Tax=Scheffersomyces xylosifermentans TaxID=1304137 RepID=UPI00315DD32F
MSAEDQFTSVQWDRGEVDSSTTNERGSIADNSNMTIVEEDVNSENNDLQQHQSQQQSQRRDSAIDHQNNQSQASGTPVEPSTSNSDRKGSVGSGVVGADKDNVLSPTGSTGEENPSNSLLISKSNERENRSPTANNAETEAANADAIAAAIVAEQAKNFATYKIETSVTSPIRDLDTASKPFISYLVTTTTDHPEVLKLSKHSSSLSAATSTNNDSASNLNDNGTTSPAKEDTPSAAQISAPGEYYSFSVRRRYGDFAFLNECLANDFPAVMIPPLPSKSNLKYLTGDTFNSEFVNKRLHSLDRFVRFILQHKSLSQSSVFHLFISDSNDWTNFTKNLRLKDINYDESGNSSSSGNGFVNKVVNEDLLTETVMNFFTSGKHKKETNKDILEINDKLKKIYENLIKLDKIFIRLNRKNHDLSVDYDHFSKQIMKLSLIQNAESVPTTEPSTSTKSGNESSLDVDAAITNNFKIFAESLDYFSKTWGELHKYVDETFLVSLKDCSRYIISLTNLIELLHNKKIDVQVLQNYLKRANSELASFGGSVGQATSSHHPPPNPVIQSHNLGIINNTTQLIKDTISTSATPHIASTATDGKIAKLQGKVREFEEAIAASTRVVNELTIKIIHEEYPNWDKFNRNELKTSMLGLCDQEIKFYKGLVNNWSDVEMKLLKRLDELS